MMEKESGDIKRIIIVAYRLPFSLAKKKGETTLVQNSGGLVSAILSLSQKFNSTDKEPAEIIWIGSGDRNLASVESRYIRLHPVALPAGLKEKYYGGFCNKTIWPLFHYFPSRTEFNSSDYDAYHKANMLFFNKLKKIVKPGDLVWVHDYQLFLLPGLIRKHLPGLTTGFFLHIPFPSYELFRLLPRKWRESILSGMTGADLIGFHTNDYTQHFLKSVKKTLGYGIKQNYITLDDRLCRADTFPIGIDYNKFKDAGNSPKVLRQRERLGKTLEKRKLVFSIDRLDYSKGFLYRLKAYERFLEKFPDWHYKVIFNMIVIPSRDTIDDYRLMKREIEAFVGRINGKYSTLDWRPVIYQYRSLSFTELVALYNISDAAFITPLRDGMNLVAKEFIASQVDSKGMLILSEMAGAAAELNEAILINPTDIDETAAAIDKALKMNAGEKKHRLAKMKERISRYDVFRWTSDFFQTMNDVAQQQKIMQVNFIDRNVTDLIRSAFETSRRRLFLIDYDGTLTPIAKTPEMAVMNRTTRKLLESLTKDFRNRVVIVSGRDRNFIDEQFKNLKVELVAEHGCFVRKTGEEWQDNIASDFSWKRKIRPLLERYVDRCSGSMIEEKTASIVWHYRNSDEDMVNLRIDELRDDLYEILRNETGLQLLEGNKVVEVKSSTFNKGTITGKIIKQEKYDFILALGDDHTDEDMFKVVPGFGFSVRVGNKLTNARFNTRNQQDIINLLKCLIWEQCSKN